MKNFFNWVLTIAIFITSMATIFILTVGSLTTKESTKTIIDNIDYNEVIKEFESSDYGNYIYEYANNHGIDKDQINSLLQSNETKEYSNEIIQGIINSYLNNQDIKISNKTKEYINKINNKYKLNLDDNSKKEIEDYTNNFIEGTLNSEIKNTYNNSEIENEGQQALISIIKTCQDNSLHTTLYTIITILVICLFLNTLKKKNFLEYIGIVFITIGIFTLLLNGIISLLTKDTTSFLASAKVILLPITNNFYLISLISIILSIVFFIIQHLINKHQNKEVVPF